METERKGAFLTPVSVDVMRLKWIVVKDGGTSDAGAVPSDRADLEMLGIVW